MIGSELTDQAQTPQPRKPHLLNFSKAPNLDYLNDCTPIYSAVRPGMAGSVSWGSPLQSRPWSRCVVPPLSSGRNLFLFRVGWIGGGLGLSRHQRLMT
jgi:hypothetical protein